MTEDRGARTEDRCYVVSMLLIVSLIQGRPSVLDITVYHNIWPGWPSPSPLLHHSPSPSSFTFFTFTPFHNTLFTFSHTHPHPSASSFIYIHPASVPFFTHLILPLLFQSFMNSPSPSFSSTSPLLHHAPPSPYPSFTISDMYVYTSEIVKEGYGEGGAWYTLWECI